MKRFLFALLVVVFLFSTVALAKTVELDESYLEDDSVVFASLNGVQPFLSDLANTEPLEEACYWLSDYANTYNIKYVSFLGRMSSGANFTYSNYVRALGKTQAEMLEANTNDTEWIKEFDKLKAIGQTMTAQGLPYGVSINLYDYYATGFNRSNHIANHFTEDDFIGYEADVEVISYNPNNFATIVNSNGTKYIVYQLEAYPQQAVLNWFKKTNEEHPDKRAFIFTTSFLDKTGEMFTQYDPTQYKYTNAPEKGNSDLVTNMVNIGTPYNGNQLWNHLFSLYDNIVFIMSANAQPGQDIVTNTFENANGYTVGAAVSNLISGYANAGAYPVLIKFSEANKTIDLRYAVPYHNIVGGYIDDSVVTIKLDNLAPLPEPDPMTLIPKVKTQYNGANTAYINGYAGNLFKPNANMTKAEASTIFARLLVGSTTLPTGNTTRFSDVKEGDWYYDAIAYLDTNNFYMSNTTDKYNPNTPITRGEFVELAYLASNLVANVDIKFTDVPENHKYYNAIIAAAASGLVNGYEDNTFRPDATITRAEVVTVINRLLSLTVSKSTISREHLTNVFSDISGHWAELQVLMASNSNVHGESFYKIDSSVFSEKGSEITFGTDIFEVSINKKNGKVQNIVYKPTGEKILATSTTPWFSYLTTTNGAILSPTSAEIVDGRLKFTYKSGYEAYFIVEAFDNYFTVELDSNLSKALKSLTFANLPFNYTPSYEDGSFRASVMSMDTKAVHATAPGGLLTTAPKAYVYANINVDVIGAKVGVAYSVAENHRDILKEITDAIDPARGIKSTVGGAYALDNPATYYDYTVVHGVDLDNVHDYGKTLQAFDVEILDLHHGTNFVTGSFNFIGARTEEEAKAGKFIDGTVYKERITDVLNSYGVDIAIHSYAQGVNKNATTILTNPKWQKDLHYSNEVYTLRGDLSKYRLNVKTYEDASKYKVDATDMPYSATYYTSQYLLIDEEIIRVTKGKGTTSGFMQVQRGQLGTTAAEHKDGTRIYHLVCRYGCFHAKAGSDLFYHIADLHAKAYNETGATMIYLDCQDAMHGLDDETTLPYYKAEFVRRIISQCNTSPIIGSAAYTVSMWGSYSKGGAVDCAYRAYKQKIKGHYESYGKNYTDQLFTSSLGWFSFNPDSSYKYKNTASKTLFRDDIDFLGAKAIASNFFMVPLGLSPSYLEPSSRVGRNFTYYGVYSRLRKANYFSEEVRDILKKGKYEYRLIKQEDGSFAFREMRYDSHKIDKLETGIDVIGNAVNPFGVHTPFIRIEQRYSTLGENEKIVLELDETKDVSSITGSKTIPTLNLTDNNAMKVKVLGNGKDGAILISVSGGSGHGDYFITTSHTGWREFILVDIDNAEYLDTKHTFSQVNNAWSNYPTYSTDIAYGALNKVQIGVSGDVSGVKMDDIKAYKVTDAPVNNPTVKIGSSEITFKTELHSGEFIEYYPDTDKAYLNYYESKYDEEGNWTSDISRVKEISFSGKASVPSGSFTYTYSAERLTEAPTRAKIVVGMQGDIIENPSDWAEPEVDLGNATLDVITY